MSELLLPIVGAAVLGGAAAGLLGTLVLGFRMPFLAIFTAHAALAGAILAPLAGLGARAGAFGGALAGALALGFVLRHRHVDPEIALGSLFSLMLGLAFLGIGLGDGPRSTALGLLWGSLLFVRQGQLLLMGAVLAALVLFVSLLGPELKLMVASRELAALLIPEAGLFTLFLVLASGVMAVNLETVGGLMVYSLVANPAAAALRLGRSFGAVLWLGGLLGAGSAVGGFALAWALNLPVGACIVLLSSALVGAAWALPQRGGRP